MVDSSQSDGANGELAITLDVDWAPDDILAEAIEKIVRHDIKLTVFATHATTVLQDLDPAQVEIGVHPNLLPMRSDDFPAMERAMRDLRDSFPEAAGIRCHSLVQSTKLLDLFAEMGFLYFGHTRAGA